MNLAYAQGLLPAHPEFIIMARAVHRGDIPHWDSAFHPILRSAKPLNPRDCRALSALSLASSPKSGKKMVLTKNT
jgi:hypothetical protein